MLLLAAARLAAAGGFLESTPSWMGESDQVDSWYGDHAALAGDVNGDGFTDVIVGAAAFDHGETDEGRVFLHLGSPSGLSAAPTWTAEGDQAGARFGDSVASAGDVNGDGFDDVIVGAFQYDAPYGNEGAAFVYHGSSGGLPSAPDWTLFGTLGAVRLGAAVSTAGDVNADGYGDVIIGATHYDHGQLDEGGAFVFHGGAAGLAADPSTILESDQSMSGFGSAVAAAGDVNGDGYGDVVVGADWFDGGQIDEGRAFVYRGSGAGVVPTPIWTGECNAAGAYYGGSVAAAGDVDGDGYGDVVVGARSYTRGQTLEGRADLFSGSSAGPGALAAWSVEGGVASAMFGTSVASAGDVDGDGFDDVLVGANGYTNTGSFEGRAYLYRGAAAGLSPTAAWKVDGDQPNALLGRSVSSAGDVDGDGFLDVIVGTYAYDHGEIDEGAVFLFRGGCGAVDPYGTGCAGSGGFTPLVEMSTNCVSPGEPYYLEVSEAWGGGLAALVVGAGRAEIPAGGGCTLLVQPPHVVALLPLGGLGPGAGSAILAGAFPVGGPSGAIDLQAFVADPTPATGWAASAGLELAVP